MKKSFLLINVILVVMITITSCSKESLGEGPEGPENGSETGDESGLLWKIDETADEIINGIHLILTYNSLNESFEGTLENTNTSTAPQVRVEVHTYDAQGNSKEFGPTTPADMAPGEIRSVKLSVNAGHTFVEFAMHPEVGGSGSS